MTFQPTLHANGGPATFTFEVKDTGGTSNGGVDTLVESLTVSVGPVNTPPSVTVPSVQSVLEDTSLTLFGATSISIADPDAGANDIRVTLTVAHGTVLLDSIFGLTIASGANDSGSITLEGTAPELDNALSTVHYKPLPNYFGSDTLMVSVNDLGFSGAGGPQTAAATLNIDVVAVNDVPSFTKGADPLVNENSAAVTVPVWAVGVSPGLGENSALQTLNFIVQNDNPPLFSVQPAISSNGTLTFTPAPSKTGTARVTVMLHDNGGLDNGGFDTSPPQSFLITIASINDPPTLDPIATQTIPEDSGEQFVSLTGIFAGPNEFQNLSVTATTVVNSVLIPNPLVSYFSPSSSGSLRFVPAPNQSGSARIKVTVSDDSSAGGSALSVFREFDVNITAVNDRPEITAPVTQTVAEDTVLAFTTANANLITVADVDAASSPVLVTLSVANGTLDLGSTTGLTFPSGGTGGIGTATVFVQGSLAAMNTALATLEYKPNLNFNGTDHLVIFAEDGGATGSGGSQSDTHTMTINVTPVNDVPGIGANQVFDVPENAFDGAFVGHVAVQDFENTGLTYTLMATGNIDNAFAIDHLGNLHVNGPLNFEAINSYTLSIIVMSGNGASATGTVTVHVGNLNDPPMATNVAITIPENTAISTVVGSVVATDQDASGPNSTRHYAITQGNFESNFAIDRTTGEIRVIAPLDYEKIGIHVFEVTVSDEGTPPLSDTAQVTVNVTDVNEEPMMDNDVFTVHEDVPVGTYIGTMHAVDFDFGSVLTYSIDPADIINSPFSIHSALGHVTVNGVLDADTHPTYSLHVKATDNGIPVKSRTVTLTVNVINVNRPAITTAPADQAVNEDGTLIFSLTNDNPNPIRIVDDSGVAGQIEVTLSVRHGTLTLATTTGIDFRIGGNATAGFRIRGVLAAINLALNGLTYRPDLDFNGMDALEVFTDDRGVGGVGGTFTDYDLVMLHVKPVIDGAPTVTTHSENFGPDNLSFVEIHHNPKDGPEVTHFQITGISNGTLYLNNGRIVVNNGNFLTAGEAGAGLHFKPTSSTTAGGFTVRASLNDLATDDSATGMKSGLGGDPFAVSIQPNQLPMAHPQTVTTPEDTSVHIMLDGHDPEGREVQFMIVSFPTKGELVPAQTSSVPSREYHYVPNANAFTDPGSPDTFTFKVNDGLADSAPATVSIQVVSVNDPPTLAPLPNMMAVRPGSGLHTIPLMAITGGPANEFQAGIVTAVSSNPSVVSIPANGVVLANPPVSGSLTFEIASTAVVGDSAQVIVTVLDSETPNGILTRVFNVAITDRGLRIANRKSMPGNVIDVPVEMQSMGGENAVAFSVRFNPAVLSLFRDGVFLGVTPGVDAVGAVLNVNTAFSNEGHFGVALALPADHVFASGPRQVAVLKFLVKDETAAMTLTSTPLEFDNGPVRQEVVDAQAVHLPAVFENGVLQISRGFEADVADRPFGTDDGFVTAADWTQVGLFAAQIQTVGNASEFQRADCAPRAVDTVLTLGNGVISLADWVQAGRYAAGLDTPTPGGGPFAPGDFVPPIQPVNRGIGVGSVALKSVSSSSSRVRILNASVDGGKSVVIRIAMDSIGKENALGFSLNFDTQALRFVAARTGIDATGGTLLTNSRDASKGRVGLALALAPGKSFGAGSQEVAEIEFVSSSANVAVETSVAFADAPIPREIVSSDAGDLRGTYESGVITIKGGVPPQEVRPTWKLTVAKLSLERDAQLRLTGNPGSGFVIETSSDLIQWTILKTVTLESGTLDVVDTDARKLSERFYRARPTP